MSWSWSFNSCDGCPRAFHFNCVNPPLDYSRPPDGEWYCNVCLVDRKLPSKAQPGLFSDLVDSLYRSNPIQYQLPQWIKDSFEDISTESTGQFVDLSIKKYPKLDKFGIPIEPDYTQLQDEKGEFIYCHWCRKSPSREMPAIPCDYCSMYWHLDCLDPPMVKRPSLFKKWMCPCHVNHILPKMRRMKNTHNDLSEIFGPDNTAIQFQLGEYDDSGQYCTPPALLQQMKSRKIKDDDDWDVFGLDEINPRNGTPRCESYKNSRDFVGNNQMDESGKGSINHRDMSQKEELSNDGSELNPLSDLPSEYSEKSELGSGDMESSQANSLLQETKKKPPHDTNFKKSRNNSTPKNFDVTSHFTTTGAEPMSQGTTKPQNLDPQFMDTAQATTLISSKSESIRKRKAGDWNDRTINKEQFPEKSFKPNTVPTSALNSSVPPDQNLWVLINAALNDF